MCGTTDTHQINRRRPPPARLRCAIAALVAALLVAACGSSSPTGTSPPSAAGRATASSSSPDRSAAASASLAFSKCMRSHGVPNFPDLGGNGMRIAASGRTISVNGSSFSASAFSLARQKCQPLLPHTSASPAQAAQQRQQGLDFARCMRRSRRAELPRSQSDARLRCQPRGPPVRRERSGTTVTRLPDRRQGMRRWPQRTVIQMRERMHRLRLSGSARVRLLAIAAFATAALVAGCGGGSPSRTVATTRGTSTTRSTASTTSTTHATRSSAGPPGRSPSPNACAPTA